MPHQSDLHRLVIAAAREFNAGHYFEAHEVLEDGLDVVPDELWELFIGLIQVAVGYHKLSQGLSTGALKLLGMGLSRLETFPPSAGGLNLTATRERAHADVQRIRAGELDAEALRRDPPRLQPLP